MNKLPTRDPLAESRARAIVARRELPDFIKGFDIRFGFSDGAPAIFVVYRSDDDYSVSTDELLRHVAEYRKLDDEVLPELLTAFEGWTPLSVIVSDESTFDP